MRASDVSPIATAHRTVMEADLHAFACLVGDFSPVHMDEPYARSSAFGQRVLHGPAVFALTSGLLVQTGVFNGHVAFLGSNFKIAGPVAIGDTIHAEIREVAARTTSDGVREVVDYEIATINQRDETVLTGTWTQLRHRADGGSGQAASVGVAAARPASAPSSADGRGNV